MSFAPKLDQVDVGCSPATSAAHSEQEQAEGHELVGAGVNNADEAGQLDEHVDQVDPLSTIQVRYACYYQGSYGPPQEDHHA